SMNRAIVLAGFMGTGKSAVGRIVAQELGRTFLDLDELVEGMAGRSIPELFAEGEETFRWWEQLALGRLDLSQPVVLATGGGTLVGAWNQARVEEALVVMLDAALDTVRERIEKGEARPLAQELVARYERRRAAYARLPHRVSTEGRTPEEVAGEVLSLAKQVRPLPPANDSGESLPVRLPGGGSYEIRIQPGIAGAIGGFLRRNEAGRREGLGVSQGLSGPPHPALSKEKGPTNVALITDSVVGPLWGETVRHDVMAARLPATLIEIPSGETHKTLRTMERIYEGLLGAGIDRGDAIVALGGGIVGDMAGFAAATWMRGVRALVQLPTSLLAMVDASVGGKNGVDHPRGKNLIGTFRHPDLVLIDPIFLETLPPRELRNGLAEVIKHAIIGDPALLEEIRRWSEDEWGKIQNPKWLMRAVRVKAEIVERDPFEQGERARLNLGHTFGHAYELLSGYELSHGEAVSVGMVTAARLSERLGLAEPGLAGEIEAVLAGVGLATRWADAADGERVWRAMRSDKKKAGKGLRFVLPRAMGDVIVTEPGAVAKATVLQVLAEQR
ncbi:MAG: 3-dehydroquinate synthase, partial [Ardenticatenaceae bacterium]